MSLINSWLGYFSSAVRQRGREYYERGRVKSQTPLAGELARAIVSGDEEYVVVLRGEQDKSAVTCTCAHFVEGHYCKHIWATLLMLERQGMNDATGEGGSIVASSFESVGPSAPKARKRDAGPQRPTRIVEPEWVSRLSLLSPSRVYQSIGSAPLVDVKQIYYVVSTELSQQHGGLVIEVRNRTTPRGGWGGLKPFKISSDVLNEMTDRTDRELCGLLLGATWVDQYEAGDWSLDHRRRSAFRLPVGTWRPMVKRMIDARRCVIDHPGAIPRLLEWDDQAENPWVLWMIGRHGDEGMNIGVELRRSGQRVSVNEPELILGGTDGMLFLHGKVASFDDHEAFRWVTQFREDERRGRSVSPLVIPPRDAARFVERLYLLPDLPEIDLPDDVAFLERQVPARPCIDIISPTAAPGGGPASKQLAAKVWFEYGGLRVEPGQTGRFVAAAADGTGATTDELNIRDPERQPEDVLADADEFGDKEIEGETKDVQPEAPSPGLIRRDLRFERIAIESLAPLGFRSNPIAEEYNLILPVRLMPAAVTSLISRGWSVRADRHIIRAAATPRLTIRSGIDWFELHGGVKYQTEQGEQFVSLPDILAAARAGQNMITLSDGTQGMLPEEWLKQHGLLAAIGKADGDHLIFKNNQAALLDVLLDQQSLVDVDEKFAEARRRLREFDQIAPADAPKEFKGELRPYQREGLGWLKFLQWFGMGGILADDMGLGKTVQVLAMLQDISKENAAKAAAATDGKPADAGRPSLVVAPRSVVFNWLDEAVKFTPDLRVLSYSGAERGSMLEGSQRPDVIVTSYGLLRRDIAKLREIGFNYVILDEAQAIKNPNSQVAKASRLLDAKHRLALTGTPVENHLGDLWSIFEYLNPGMLGNATRFADLIRGTRGGPQLEAGDEMQPPAPAPAPAPAAPVEPSTDELDEIELSGSMSLDDARHMDIARAASRALRPYILRRTKQQVLTELPEKTEQTIICEMDKSQRKVYDDLLKYYRGTLLSKLDSAPGAGTGASGTILSGGAAKSGMPMMVLEALLRLRQASCHPGLIDDSRTDQPSAKLEALLENLAELIDEGHKALVFSQFTSMLAIVRKRLDETGIKYEYLDGKTQDRKSPVQRFQSDPKCPVFLISLKAGGLGLNLTAADYVFILDPWWNPAVEQQAIDRAHRIGQTRHVFAYRLICKDTVEQRIAELQQKKKKLADAIIGGEENLLRSLTRDDLELLLS